jgi:SAM-dependent methyltransferase
VSELAFSFGRIAAEYDDVRPEYAPEALERAQEALGLSDDSTVVDLGAGSGKLTRALVPRFAEVVAVEPNEEMRGVLAGRSAGIKVLAGTAERMPLPDEFADAVFVGDAFHWFDGLAAVEELARVVRPGGGVALLWNHWWSDGDDGTVNALDPPLPAEAQALFDEEAFARTEQLSGAQVVDLFATVSSIASLRPDEREELKRSLRALLEPSYLLEITTVLHWTHRA